MINSEPLAETNNLLDLLQEYADYARKVMDGSREKSDLLLIPNSQTEGPSILQT